MFSGIVTAILGVAALGLAGSQPPPPGLFDFSSGA